MQPLILISLLKAAAVAQDWAAVDNLLRILERLYGVLALPADRDELRSFTETFTARTAQDADFLAATGRLPGQHTCDSPDCDDCALPPSFRPPELPPASETLESLKAAILAQADMVEALSDVGYEPATDAPFTVRFQTGTVLTLDRSPARKPFILWSEIPDYGDSGCAA